MSATILPFVKPPYEAVMALHSRVPQSAMTAGLLGIEREGHAVQVSADGLMLTVGYAVLEAEEVWLTNHRGQTSEAVVLAQDFDAGLALIKPMVPLGREWIESTGIDRLEAGASLSILTSESRKPMSATLFARQEFAGRWEYLLEEALYTVPMCEHWSGAALLDDAGRLCGIGSLALGMSGADGKVLPGNLFVPTELVMPNLEYMALHGEPPGEKRPWLGLLAEEHMAELHVVGVYADAPAALAGIRPGDVVLSVARQPVSSLAGFFRSLWRCGPAGSEIPLLVRNDDGTREVRLDTIDRTAFFLRQESAVIN